MENTTPLGSFVPELPATDGQWSGTRGDSDWLFDLGATKWDIYDSNPLQIPHPTRTWGEIIGDCYYPMRTASPSKTASRILTLT